MAKDKKDTQTPDMFDQAVYYISIDIWREMAL